MLTKEDIQLLSQLMDEKLEPINKRLNKVDERLDKVDERLNTIDERLDTIDERLDVIEENTEITRSCTNDIIEWIDFNFHDEYPFPVKKIKTV